MVVTLLCTVLYCILLYSTVFYCALLYANVLYCKVIYRMIVNALLLADDHLDLLGKDVKGQILKMSKACDDVRNLLKLSDEYIFKSIRFCEGETKSLEKARVLLYRILNEMLIDLRVKSGRDSGWWEHLRQQTEHWVARLKSTKH